jgi:hypothetical protein
VLLLLLLLFLLCLGLIHFFKALELVSANLSDDSRSVIAVVVVAVVLVVAALPESYSLLHNYLEIASPNLSED